MFYKILAPLLQLLEMGYFLFLICLIVTQDLMKTNEMNFLDSNI